MASFRCVSSEFWNSDRCIPCEQIFDIHEGYEFNPHCGRSDDGGAHAMTYSPCREGTFNNGSFVKCQPCHTCQEWKLLSSCTAKSNARCCEDGQDCRRTSTERSTTSEASVTSAFTIDHKINATKIKTFERPINTQNPPKLSHSNTWIILGALFALMMCVYLIYLFYISKRKCSRREKKCINGSFKNVGILEDGISYKSQEDDIENLLDKDYLLPPDIQAASLQTVLNNLDVVEELVILLDPDTPGVKSTRHLAASCSLPFTWINYAYSMKDSKSPLVAMLERVIASHPHWNVGHFAGLLSKIGRLDAVVVLKKLNLSMLEI